jgi:hypothetical protein
MAGSIGLPVGHASHGGTGGCAQLIDLSTDARVSYGAPFGGKSMKRIAKIGVLGLLPMLTACPPEPITGTLDATTPGCMQPPASTFALNKVDFQFAESQFTKNLKVGQIKLATDPKVETLTSLASKDATVSDWLRCLAIKRDGYTREQAVYLDRLIVLKQANPTPAQLVEWERTNPFPK